MTRAEFRHHMHLLLDVPSPKRCAEHQAGLAEHDAELARLVHRIELAQRAAAAHCRQRIETGR